MSQIGRAAPQWPHDTARRTTAVVAAALLAWLLASAIAYRPPLERPLSPIQLSPADVQATPAAPALTSAPFAPTQTVAPGNGIADPALQTAAPAIQTAPSAIPSAKTPVELPNQSFVPGFQPGPRNPLKPGIPPQN